MAIKATSTKVRRREFVWTYEGDDCKIVYNANAITSDDLERLRETPDAAGDQAMVQVLSATLISWEVLDDDGNEWPHDPAALSAMPFAFVSDVLDAIGEHAQAAVGG
jgi:hypothetical protein